MSLTKADILKAGKLAIHTNFVVPKYDKPVSPEKIEQLTISATESESVVLASLTPYDIDSQHFQSLDANDPMFVASPTGKGFLVKRILTLNEYSKWNLQNKEGKVEWVYRVVPTRQFVETYETMKRIWDEKAVAERKALEAEKHKQALTTQAHDQATEQTAKQKEYLNKVLAQMFEGQVVAEKDAWLNIDTRPIWDDKSQSYLLNTSGSVSISLPFFEQLAYLFSEWKQKS
jgi:hypothetical protein